jgi:hypothetical protein
MPSTMAIAQLGDRALDGVRVRALGHGRAWYLFDGEHLAADPTLCGDLSAMLRPIAAEVFPCAAPAFLDLVSGPDRLATRSCVAVLRGADGRVGGMVSQRSGEWGGERCFYAASAFVRPSEQGAGVVASAYGLLMRAELMRAPLRPMYAVVRTPNPVVYAAWRQGGRKMGGEVEPRLDLAVSDDVRRVALATAEANGFGERVESGALIVRGAYEGGILPGGAGPYGERPRSGDRALDALFDRLLGPEDALMVVGRMSLHRAAAMAGDRLIRGQLGRLGGRRRGAVLASQPSTHVRVRGPERRGGDRRGPDRRGGDRRHDERRGHDRRVGDRRGEARRASEPVQVPQPSTAPRPWNGVERRAADRRGGDRRGTDRRALERRGPERRDLERRSGPRRLGDDRRDGHAERRSG